MQKNDCVLTALGSGQYNDLLHAYYLDNGATSPHINDAEREFLVAQGAAFAQLNDMWFEFLRGRGYLGSLSDMLWVFWCEDGGIIEGEELLINGYFTGTWDENDIPEGHILDGEIDINNYLEANDIDNRLRVVSDTDGLIGVNQNVLTPGAEYNYVVDLESIDLGPLNLIVGGGSGPIDLATPGVHMGTRVGGPNNATVRLTRPPGSPTDAWVNSWSIRRTDPDELLLNPNFAGAWGAEDVPQGNILLGIPDENTYLEADGANNRLRIFSEDAVIGLQQDIITIETEYNYTIDIEEVISGEVSLNLNGNSLDFGTPGVRSGTLISGDQSGYARLQRAVGGCDITINSWSIKEA